MQTGVNRLSMIASVTISGGDRPGVTLCDRGNGQAQESWPQNSEVRG